MAEKDIKIRVMSDLKYSSSKMLDLHKEIKNDFEFAQGNQWAAEDIAKLEKRGVKALTINKIKPILSTISGIERQSRSDMIAQPEGGEDVIPSEIATRLIKNVSKNSRVEIKQSEMFKNGSTGGMCFLEPYIDYSFDLINGDLKWKKISAQNIFLDPDFQEYDLSDSRFLIKVTQDLNKDDLLALFPDKEKEINNIEYGKLDLDSISAVTTTHDSRGEAYKGTGAHVDVMDNKEDLYDLIDYYYKEAVKKWFVVLEEQGQIKQFDSLEEAEALVEDLGKGEIVTRNVPVVKLYQLVGDTEMYNDVSWSYPAWKNYPIMPYFAELITEELDCFELKIQGLVRGIKDLNIEYNKRRTQELNHLNSSANSGYDIEKGSLDEAELAKLKKYGSAPGVVIQRKKGYAPISRITPMPLSQGHAQAAVEHSQDLKEASRVNLDLLANDSQSQSGRAILLKQKQGLVMIQEMLDNFAETKRLIGRFILSQFSELFTVESAMRVLGNAYIADNFKTPVSIIVERALTKKEQGEELSDLEDNALLQFPDAQAGALIVDDEGVTVTITDTDAAEKTVEMVLKDVNLNKYDVAIGEGPYQDTVRLANFTDLKDLATQGVPMPPQLLIESSMLSEADKRKAVQMLAQQAQQSQAVEA